MTESRRTLLSLVAALLCAALVLSLPNAVAAQPSWEYSPYRILVWTCRTPSVALPPDYQQRFAERLARHVELTEGAAWQVEVLVTPPALSAEQEIDDRLLTVAAIEAAAPKALQVDKLFFVTLGGEGRNYRIAVRELDCRTRVFGPRIERPAKQLAELPRAATAAMREAFAAMVRIESGVANVLTVRLRAGGLVTKPDSKVVVAQGDILQPVIRRNDRVGNPLRIDTVDWTFLRVTGRDQTNPNLLQVRVHSGFRSPIRGRVASNREQYALAIRPNFPSTAVFIEAKVRREVTAYPLAGLEIYVRDPLTGPQPESVQPDAASDTSPPADRHRFLGYSDWRGAIEIPKSESPLQIVYLKSGGQLLARLPMVAGLTPRLVASVVDDNARLEAESNVRGFNNQLIDLVAQRQILAARIRRHLAENDVDKARELLEQFGRLPTRREMQRQLERRRTRQRISDDQLVRSRIELLYDESRRTLATYLSSSLGTSLIREVDAAGAVRSKQ